MAKVSFELHPRDAQGTCHIYVNGVLVEKCAAADRFERLAAYGYKAKRYGGYQSSARKVGR